MKAKWLVAATVCFFALNNGALAAPKKAVKPIPEAFHGHWVGGYLVKGKPLSRAEIAAQCTYLKAKEGSNIEPIYAPYAEKLNVKEGDVKEDESFSLISTYINKNKIKNEWAYYPHGDSSDEIPIKYTRYSSHHIQGTALQQTYYGDTETTREKFNYRIQGDKLFYGNKADDFLTRCPD